MRTFVVVRALCIVLVISPIMRAQDHPVVLVVYHSQQGHTHVMAEAVARGTRTVKGITVKLLTVDQATNDDLLAADAIIVGSPVHNANVTPEIAAFISRWPWEGSPLRDKIGACFVSGGGISAGEELTQMNILHSMLIYGMIVVGGADWTSAFGASAITDELPFANESKNGTIAGQFQKKAEGLGKRVAELTLRWKKNR